MRNLALQLFFRLGGFRIWRFLKRHDVIILCLHGVMDEGVPTSWVPLRPQYSRASLEQALALLKKYYNFVTLDEALAMLRGEIKLRPYSMVMTFDDGYLNNMRHALPILKNHNVPSVMYIACSNVEERKPFWFDRLDYALQYSTISDEPIHINGEQVQFTDSGRASLKATFKKLRDLAKRGDRDDREMLAELDSVSSALESRSGKALAEIFEGDDWSAVMTWEQVAEMSEEELVDIGSHTINHIRLGKVQRDVAMPELSESKSILEKKTGQPCRHFCYPNGSVNQDTPSFVSEAGYASAVTTQAGTNPANTDPMLLKRIHLPESNDESRILLVASGLADAMSAIRGS